MKALLTVVLMAAATLSRSVSSAQTETPPAAKPATAVRQYSIYEFEILKKLTALIVKLEITESDYIQIRKICVEVHTSNRDRFAETMKSMLIGGGLTGEDADLNRVWNASPEFNLAVLFAVIAVKNNIDLSKVEREELLSRGMGVSALLHDKKLISFVGDLVSKLSKPRVKPDPNQR